jgi:hypothetical protein
MLRYAQDDTTTIPSHVIPYAKRCEASPKALVPDMPGVCQQCTPCVAKHAGRPASRQGSAKQRAQSDNSLPSFPTNNEFVHPEKSVFARQHHKNS